MQIRPRALDILCLPEPEAKSRALEALATQAETWQFEPAGHAPIQTLPGRPERPRLVDPVQVPTR